MQKNDRKIPRHSQVTDLSSAPFNGPDGAAGRRRGEVRSFRRYLHLLLHLQLIVHLAFSCRLSQALRVKGRSQHSLTQLCSLTRFKLQQIFHTLLSVHKTRSMSKLSHFIPKLCFTALCEPHQEVKHMPGTVSRD